MNAQERIKTAVAENKIIIFMKGSPQFPQCGFSQQTSAVLKACNVEFAYIDVLAEPEIRTGLPQFSNWPTFPQVFVKGELLGGCDIVTDLYQKGDLQKIIEETTAG